MLRCKNTSSGQETTAEENERPWRREGSKYIHIQTGLAFNTGASVERFHNIFLTKEIVAPNIVNKDLFKSATYASSKSMFFQQGLLRFIHLTYEFFCPNLIRQFYANLRTTKGGSPSLISYIDGKTVFIDGAGLTSLFGLRRGEITENLDETFQDEAIWRQLGLDHRDLKFRNSSNPSVVNLTLIQRVQQYIFSYVLLPRDSNHGVVNKDDIRLFHVLLNDVKFDWVHFFIVALSDGTRFSHLRFAIPVMHILAHCKIDFTRDTQGMEQAQLFQPPPPPPPPPPARQVTLKTLKDNGAEEFLDNNIAEPQIAFDWLDQTTRVLKNLRILEADRPKLAVQLLWKGAYEWWKRARTLVGTKADRIEEFTTKLQPDIQPYLSVLPTTDFTAAYNQIEKAEKGLIAWKKSVAGSKERSTQHKGGVMSGGKQTPGGGHNMQHSKNTNKAGHFKRDCPTNSGPVFPTAETQTQPSVARPPQSQRTTVGLNPRRSQSQSQSHDCQQGGTPARTYAM
ncbi:unnamed protein product [Cuscuta campestris]|uniref:Uncharacterized protein n=1 Tax=Cuscuta campestris TaxID=132261 RepID=A0A484KS07_9ASTE|nr:unnamed protein product [Cuscuta campestris]